MARRTTTSVLRYTTVTPVFTPPPDTDDRPWVTCRLCRYEKRLGDPCGEPCV